MIYVKLRILLFLLAALLFLNIANPSKVFADPTPPAQPKQGDYCGQSSSCKGSDLDGDGTGDDASTSTCHLGSNLEPVWSDSAPNTCNPYNDQHCLGGSCATLYKSAVYFDPNNSPELGKKVQIIVTSTLSCSTNAQIDIQNALVDPKDFTKICTPVSNTPSCSGNSKDKLRCYWEYDCIANRLSDSKGGGPNPFFTVSFKSDNNSACSSISNYTVIQPPECVQSSGSGSIDPLGLPNKQVIARSLDDDKRDTIAINTGTQPKEINKEIATEECSKLPQAAVQTGFFNAIPIRQLLCDVPVVATIQSVLGSTFLANLVYCPIDVNIVATNDTKCLEDSTAAMIKSIRPGNITPTPPPSTCYLAKDQDFTKIKLEGNTAIDNITNNLGNGDGDNGNIGAWNIRLPKFSDIVPDGNNFGLSLGTVNFNQDTRVPLANCWEKLNYQSTFFKGYAPHAGDCMEQQ